MVLCLHLWVGASASGGQTTATAPATQPQSSLPRTRSAVYEPQGLLKLDVVVTDASGKPVSDLSRDDFKLLDNRQPTKILSFQAINRNTPQTTPPAEIILVLDTLDLPNHLAAIEQREVSEFLTQRDGHLDQPISIYSLAHDSLRLLARPSLDGNALASAVSHPKQAAMSGSGIGSARGEYLGSSVADHQRGQLASQALAEIATTECRKPGRKLLFWIGPGWKQGTGSESFSNQTKEKLFASIHWYATLLRQARIALYSFSLGEAASDPRAVQYKDHLAGVRFYDLASINDLDRKVLAIQSGGQVFSADDGPNPAISNTGATGPAPEATLVNQLNLCVAEAASFYTLSFDPAFTNHFDDYRDLRVQITRPGLIARTNTGYYDQPYFYDLPHTPPTRLTVSQFEKELSGIQGKRDGETARELSQFELSERLSSDKLAALKNTLHGSKAAEALTALADASAFLAPPPSEILADPLPDAAGQKHISELILDYVRDTMPRLPNFFAVRSTAHYEEAAEHSDPSGRQIGYQPLHWMSTAKETMLYRNGREVAEAAGKKNTPIRVEQANLATVGTFGLILGAVTDAIAAPGGLTWSRWEHSSTGRRAVFAFTVPQGDSRYRIGYCCLPDGGGNITLQVLTGYHGEIAVDPESGAILRLALQADLRPDLPLHRSDILVEYGPVEIGSKTYISPLRSVSISRSRTVMENADGAQSFRAYGPFTTLLNDVSFTSYHIFRSESTLLTGFEPVS